MAETGDNSAVQTTNLINSDPNQRNDPFHYKQYEVDPTQEDAGGMKNMKEHNESKGWMSKLPFTIFVMIGMIQLIGWNALLNMIFGVLVSLNYSTDTSSITAVYSTLNLAGTAACTYWAEFFVRPLWTYVGLIWTGVNALVFAGVIYAKSSTAYALLHLVAASMGIAACLTGCSSFGYANYFPQNYGGALSAGLGVAGVVTFVVWMLAKHAIFEDNTAGARGSSWLMNVIVALLSLVTVIMAMYFFKQPSVKAVMQKAEIEKKELEASKTKTKHTDDEEALTKLPEEETILQTIKSTFMLAMCFFLTMFITLLCFPTIGPFSWGKDAVTNDVLVGVFQIGDLVGRYAPNFLSWILLKKRTLIIATYLRLIFIVTFVLSFTLNTNAFFGNTAFQVIEMLALSVTNGWLISCCFMRIPEFAKTNIAKARSGSIGLFAVLLGIFVGQWAAYFITQ